MKLFSNRKKSTAVASFAVAGLSITGLALGTGSASADAGTTPLGSVGTQNVCLDSNYQNAVYPQQCNGNNYQRWTEKNVPLGDGFAYPPLSTPPGALGAYGPYNLVNDQTSGCLDSNANGDVYTNPCEAGNQYQMWNDHVYPDGRHRFKNRATGRVLQFANGYISTQPLGNNTTSQAEFYRG